MSGAGAAACPKYRSPPHPALMGRTKGEVKTGRKMRPCAGIPAEEPKGDDNSLLSSETPENQEDGQKSTLTPAATSHPTAMRREGPVGSLDLCFPEHLLPSHQSPPREI